MGDNQAVASYYRTARHAARFVPSCLADVSRQGQQKETYHGRCDICQGHQESNTIKTIKVCTLSADVMGLDVPNAQQNEQNITATKMCTSEFCVVSNCESVTLLRPRIRCYYRPTTPHLGVS